MQLLFEGGVNLKVLLDTTKNCFSQDIVICGIRLTELMSFDFDYNGTVAPRAVALGGSYHFFVSNTALIQGRC